MLEFISGHPTRGGILIGLLISIPHIFLPMTWSVPIAALTLVFIAGIYVGFAIMNGAEQAFVTEISIAVTFAALGTGGLLMFAWIIPFGLIGHAFWDYLHHRKSNMLTEVPKWYIPFCIVVDIILALTLATSWSGIF